MSKSKNGGTGPGAKVRIFRQMDSFCIEIARKSRKPFNGDYIISVSIPDAITPIRLADTKDVLTDAWFIKADGRRRTIE